MSGGRRKKSSGKKPQHNSRTALTKSQRRDTMARKREERAARQTHKKQQQAKTYLTDDETYASFSAQLAKMGLELRDVTGDGNCLFRALGDQLEGHGRNHLKHRHDVVAYMLDHREDFEPFVEDDVPFDKHVKNLNEIGTYAGNDAIVAFARLNKLHVVIHQVNTPCWEIHGTDNPAARELHISYHNGDHYSSIRKIGDTSETPANIKLDSSVMGSQMASKNKANQANKFTKKSWQQNNDYTYGNSTYNGDYGDYAPDGNADKSFGENENIVECIKRLTCCEDESLILETLENAGMDAEVATDKVLSFMQTNLPEAASDQSSSKGGLWAENGTGSRLFGGLVNGDAHAPSSSQDRNHLGAKPKQSVSQKNVMKKREKKLRAEQRRRQERLGNSSSTGGGALSSDDEFTVVAADVGTLKI